MREINKQHFIGYCDCKPALNFLFTDIKLSILNAPLTNSRKSTAHRVFNSWHPLLLRGQEIILPNLEQITRMIFLA